MTENEIKELKRRVKENKVLTFNERKYINNALEEIQQYRAIGLTPELIEAMQGHNIALINDLGEYQQIGTIEEFKALKEKNEPKKLMHNGANWYRCPNGCEVHKKTFEKDWYCPKCGVKLDWNE